MSPAPSATAPKMHSVWIDVTPAMAQQWLDLNTGNRHVRAGKVNSYAAIMTVGRWRETHQGISFDEKGNLLDGQHRLLAVVKSGVTVRMLVTYNQPRDNMKAIDRGAARTTADTLRIFYNLNNSTMRAATARIVISLRKGIVSGTYAADDDEVEAEILERSDHYDWIFELFHKNKKYTSPVYAALAYAYPASPEKVREFAALIIEPANLPTGSIIFKATAVIAEGVKGGGSGGRMELFRRVLRCIQAHLRGEQLKQVKDSDEGQRYFAKLRGETLPPKEGVTP